MTSIEPELMRHHAAMRRLATRLVVVDDVDDVVQETMARAIEHRPRGDLGAWLGQVLRNVVRFRRRSDARRRRRDAAARPSTEDPGRDAREPVDTLQELEAAERISRALRELPEPYRTTLVQRYFLQRSFADVAREQGVREDAVRQRHRRGLDMMRRALAKHGDDGATPLTRARLALLFTPCLRPTAPHATGTLAKLLATCSACLTLTTMKTKAALTIAAVVALAGLSTYVLWDPDAPAPMSPADPSHARAAVGDVTSPIESGGAAEPDRVAAADAPHGPNGPLAATAGVDVRVIWDDDGTPAADVRVFLTEQEGAARGAKPDHEAVTGEDGVAAFRGLRAASYRVEGRFRPAQSAPQVVEVAATSLDGDPFELRIRRGTTVTGRVVDPDGDGIGGATILRAGWGSSWPQEVGVTNADGTFELTGLHGRISMGARAAGFAQSTMRGMNLNDKAGDTLEIELAPAAADLTVKVVGPDGAPVAGARVAVGTFGRQAQPRRGANGRDEYDMPAHTETDARGVAQLGGLRPGTWSLQAKAEGLSSHSEELEVPPQREGDAPRQIVREVRLPASIVIEGHARDGDGAPLERVFVGYGQHGHLVYASTTTKPDGSYRLTGAPAGTVGMHAQRKGLDRRETIETMPGRAHRWDVTFAAERKVHGSVRWDDGEAAARAGFAVWSLDATPRWHTIDHTDEQGRFVLEMPDHVRSVRVQVRTGLTFYQVVHEGPLPAGNLDIVLGPEHRPSATLRGRVVGPDGAARGGADLWHGLDGQGNSMPIEVDADGRFAQRVTPGTYNLAIEVAGLARKRVAVDVGVEQDKDLGDIVLEHPAALRVIVDGAPGDALTFWLTHVESKRRSRLQVVDGQGSVGGLPGGRYRVQVCGERLASESREVFLQAAPGGGEPTELRIPARPARPLNILVKLPEGAQRGRSRAADIEIVDADGQLAVQHRASISSDDSVYTKLALAPGRYVVRAREDELSADATIEVRAAGPEPMDVTLQLRSKR